MEIIDFEDKFLNDLYELQKDVWGEGSDTDEIFKSLASYKIKLAVNGDKLIGAVVSHEISAETFFVDFVIVRNDNQFKGVGTQLLGEMIEYAKDNNYHEIKCEAIGVYGKINSKKLLEKFGFEKTGYFENYWGKKCPNFFCVQCGKKPCVCSMTSYEKKIK